MDSDTGSDDVTYRLFRLSATGEAEGSLVTIKAESDAAALRHAQTITRDTGAMLCKGTRVVAAWTMGQTGQK